MPRQAPSKSAARKLAALPAYVPQLAKLVQSPPVGAGWVHELKYDGYRMGALLSAGEVRLESRRNQDWSAAFPEVCAALAELRVKQALLDGEVAIVLPDGRTSFQALQNALSGQERAGLVYMLFDLLHVDGRDLRALPLEARKRELAALLARSSSARLRYSEHFAVPGSEVLRSACALRAEGIVSKRLDQPYRGGRNEGWLKTKCLMRQEFVVGGFTDPEGARVGIGSLLIGYYKGGKLVFAGKVGTGRGFTAAYTAQLRRELAALERKDCPFSPRPAGWLGRHAHWLEPTRVAEVTFTEWTASGSVRHASLQGFRIDKLPTQVTREEPTPVPSSQSSARAVKAKRASERVQNVVITSGARIVYPALGVSKLELAQYYAAVAKHMLRHVQGRPLTLVRCAKQISRPDALRSECSFLRHTAGMNAWAPASLRRVHIPELKKLGEYLVVEDAEDLVTLAQGDAVELHAWNAHADDFERPDQLVFGLDPAAEVPWASVVEGAHLVRQQLERVGLTSWVKLTGGKGVHLVAPIVPELSWKESYAVAKVLAEAAVAAAPKLFVTSFAKRARNARILIDAKRNHRGAIVVCTFSARARPDATVAVPISWAELDASGAPPRYDVRTVLTRLAKQRRDPWREFWSCRQRLLAPPRRRAARALV